MSQTCLHLALALVSWKICRSSNKFIIYLYANIATLHYEKLHSLTVKKIIIWYNFSYLVQSFQNFLKQISTHSFFKVHVLKLLWSFSLFTH